MNFSFIRDCQRNLKQHLNHAHEIVSGLDLLTDKGQEGLDEEMKSKLPDIESVSHVYFFAYIMDLDPAKEIPVNVQLLERAVTAIEHLSKNLKFVVLPTGTKAYGVHIIDQLPFKDNLPLSEDLPRIVKSHASETFYYNQVDFLKKHSESKDWSWCQVRPDGIIGFVPNNNVQCLPQHLCTVSSSQPLQTPIFRRHQSLPGPAHSRRVG